MDRIINATYDGEVFRPDEPVELASNMKVKVIIPTITKKLKLKLVRKKGKGRPYSFLEYAMSSDLDLPSDFSSNLDEYLYGGKALDEE